MTWALGAALEQQSQIKTGRSISCGALTLPGMAQSPWVLPLEESLTSELGANPPHIPPEAERGAQPRCEHWLGAGGVRAATGRGARGIPCVQEMDKDADGISKHVARRHQIWDQ